MNKKYKKYMEMEKEYWMNSYKEARNSLARAISNKSSVDIWFHTGRLESSLKHLWDLGIKDPENY